MSGYRLPPPHGAYIDRGRSVRFAFNGRSIAGFRGDTVASALIAQGVSLVSRSFKLHRPRGIFSCGVEEPSGLLDVGRGAHRSANTRATEIAARDGLQAVSGNCWPSLGFDLASVNSKLAGYLPAGFYYKTFMWPHWRLFEPAIRRMAGLGRAGDGADPDRYDEVSVNPDVLVVGAGAAGMQAALSAAGTGAKVMLVESEPQHGGWRGGGSRASTDQAGALARAGVELKTRCTVVALYDHQLAVAIESLGNGEPTSPVRERLWKIRPRQIVLATGAFERPMLFPDNDRPGVMLAGAVERYAAHYGVACGHKVALAAACDGAYPIARELIAAGIEVAAIIDRRPPQAIADSLDGLTGVRLLRDSAIVGVRGGRCVAGIEVASGGALHRIDADLVASAGGWTPNVSLYSQAGGTLKWMTAESMFVPDRRLSGIAVVGACAGVFDLDAALTHAEETGRSGPGAPMPVAPVGGAGHVPGDNRPTAAEQKLLRRKPGKLFVDLQNDVCAGDIELAARENYRAVEHLKRYTTTGMATDQGKTSNVNALVLMGRATQRSPGDVGTTRFRPPFRPVTINAIVGGRSGERYRPIKRLMARAFHQERGALFEEFGGWERPAAFPAAGEDLMAAAEREAAEVRRGVGLFDGSPLGQIEIYGPDAAAFLDLMYVGPMSTLGIGQARYGVMLNENGVIVDDGIVVRLGPRHFLVSTTSAGVERTSLAFEEWLQCEFVDMRVFVLPVTSQWGNVTVSGTNAWALLERVGFDARLAPASMKHMSIIETAHEGYPVRVLRASFNGELGYEVNLPPSRTETLFRQLWDAGRDLGVCVYGIEALMIMRIEKGFIHVGVDTDGTTSPQDVGLARGIERKGANFVGRRSLTRPAGRNLQRLQLIGLLPIDRKSRLPVGAHLAHTPPPSRTDGFVTSSCFSPALQHPIALAMLKNGTARLGEKLSAWHLGRTIEVEVVTSTFFDPKGERLHG